ncbi:MAG TPA: response regulator [Terriglobales bacterium]|nr:response regulator [Terriglobales bacterium]
MRVLIIDDEKSVADTLVMILQSEGHEAAAAYNGPTALEKIDSFIPDCVISDVIMPGMNGIEVCATLETRHPRCQFLLFSGQASSNELVEKARADGHTWELLAKPIDPGELLTKLASLDSISG